MRLRRYATRASMLALLIGSRAVAQAIAQAPAPGPAATVPRHLRFGYESSTEHNTTDAKVDEAVLRLLTRINTARHPGQQVTTSSPEELLAVAFSYSTPCSIARSDAIVMLTPIKYLECQEELRDAPLVPLFVVQKHFVKNGYYSALLISDAGSSIKRLDAPAIETLVLGSPSSTSSFVAPLFMLWQAGRIPTPTMWGARQAFKSVVVVADGHSVKDVLTVRGDVRPPARVRFRVDAPRR